MTGRDKLAALRAEATAKRREVIPDWRSREALLAAFELQGFDEVRAGCLATGSSPERLAAVREDLVKRLRDARKSLLSLEERVFLLVVIDLDCEGERVTVARARARVGAEDLSEDGARRASARLVRLGLLESTSGRRGGLRPTELGWRWAAGISPKIRCIYAQRYI